METLLGFALASLILVVIPGPNVVYIVTRGVAQGRAAAIASTLGVETGMLVHIAAAAAGLSALVTRTAVTFTAVKLVGAAYLLWLAIAALRSAGKDDVEAPVIRPRSSRRLFAHGFAISVLNPKVAVFFLAFLPQFVDPARPILGQTVTLGLVFLAVATLCDLTYAALSGSIGRRLEGRAARRRTAYVEALVYTGLAVAVATSAADAGDR